MCENDPNCEGTRTVPLPPKDDPHGWTVGFEILLASDRIYRTVGWVGTHAAAEKVCMIAAVIYSPILSFGAVPAPRTNDPENFSAVTARPPALPDHIRLDPAHATAIPAEYLAGADVKRIINAVMPTPVMTAARVVELLEERGHDVVALYNGGRVRTRQITDALGEDGMEAIQREFPTDNMTMGIRPDELPCICGNCNRDGDA